MRVRDVFGGIGGFSLGLMRAGMEIIEFCEINEFAQLVLNKNFPGVFIHEDITTARFDRPVDLVAAGFPCQDISYHGKGAGLTADRSGLFWQILRTNCVVGLPKLLLENVAALLARGMGVVLGALSQIGYDAEWDCIPAGAVGAPHRRDRVWIIAHDRSKREQGCMPRQIQEQSEFSWLKDVRRPEELPQRSDLYPSKLCGSGNGISERLDACGNAVMPQIVEILGNAIMEVEAES